MSRSNSIEIHKNLQALAPLRQWVAYSGEPKADGTINKAPLNPKTGGNAQNHNPATWATRQAAEAHATALKAPGHKPGIGIELGDLGNGTALCGVDLDGCHRGADGLEPWAQAICDRFNTYAEISPSGEGVKLFFLVKTEDLPAVRKATGNQHKKEWKRSRHYGVELPLSNNYFTVTGLAYGDHGDALRLVPLADLLWLVNQAGPAFLKGGGEVSGKDGSRSAEAYRLLLDLFRAGSTEKEAVADIKRDKGPAGEWWREQDGRDKEGVRQQERALAQAKGICEADLAEMTADFDSCWTREELDEIECAGLAGDPADTQPKSRALTPAADLDDWGAPMMQGDKPINNQHNAILYLGRNLDSILPDLAHNEMTHRDEWRGGEVTDSTIVLTRAQLERRGLKTIGKELVSDAVSTVARLRQFHPIRNMLNGLAHDGSPRLDSWLVRFAGAEDTPYTRAVGRKFLLQMVARVMQPGCKADHTLVLIGPQGAGKSALCRLLAGAAYFTDTLPAITGGKDVMEHLQGVWLAELAELAPSRKSEAEDLKAFLTGTVDRFRVAYGKRTESFPRQNVFVGTTNDDEFLRDPTGGRRFWPVHVGKIDLAGLAAERDQLFAEAVAAYRAGESWWMEAAFEEAHARPMQDAARVRDSWAEEVVAWLDKPVRGDQDFDEPGQIRAEVTASEVMAEALDLTSAQQTMAIQKRVADVLKGLGWVKGHTRRGNVWKRPPQ